MALLTSMWALDIAIFLFSFFFILHLYLSKDFGYWKRKKIPFVKPLPFIGTFKDLVLLRCTIGEYLENVYLKHDGLSYVGIFGLNQPILVVRDRDLIKQILIKDFDYFTDRMFTANEAVDPLANKVLFGAKGEVWKHTRSHLSQTFTSAKMKKMFPLMESCAKQLVNQLEVASKTGETVDVKGISARYTTDVTATCVFGIETNCINDENEEFWQKTKLIFTFTFTKHLSGVLMFFAPKLAAILRLQLFEQAITDFIWSVTMASLNHRMKTKEVRKDFLDLLIQLKLEGKITDDEPGNEQTMVSKTRLYFKDIDIVAQGLQFLGGGYETSSSTMAFALYLLAHNQAVQNKLRQELKVVINKNNGNFTYDSIMDLKYLDSVVKEVLRLYPVLAFLERKVGKSYKIPGTEIILEKGTPVVIPIMGIHKDPKYFPNPLKFDPDRFSEENLPNIPNFAFLPFGDGPRNCIGKRLADMQVKLGLSYILSNFQVVPAVDTPKKLVIEPKGFLLTPKGELPFIFRKI